MPDSDDQSTPAQPAVTTPASTPQADPGVLVTRSDPGVIVTKTGRARDVETK